MPVSCLEAGRAMMANTTDAAPLSPTKETSSCCLHLLRNGAMMANTDRGRATKVMNRAIRMAGIAMAGSCEGKASSPNRKNMIICIRLVSPSKKGTRVFLPRMLALPRTMPTM